MVTVGAVVVAVSASGGGCTTVIQAARDWSDRQIGRHKVSITIDNDTTQPGDRWPSLDLAGGVVGECVGHGVVVARM